MADEVKQKRPVPPQFLKKKKEKEEAEKLLAESLPDSPAEITVPEEIVVSIEIDKQGMIRDLMFNRYVHIMEKEARPIVEKMISDGSAALHDVKWFLAHSERVQLAKELKEKYGLSR